MVSEPRGGRPRPGHLQRGGRLWPRPLQRGDWLWPRPPTQGATDCGQPAGAVGAYGHGRLQRGARRGGRLQGSARKGLLVSGKAARVGCPRKAIGATPAAYVGAATTMAHRGKRRT
ncbi:hypothetical protein BHE74_00057008 [Ensete ventricosum]|nr:hypothetical protein BHE74_00057008 [Ensete ventricosum]